MSSWNLDALRKFVESSSEEKEDHLERINSVARAIDIYRYHLSQAKDAIDRIVPSTDLEAMQLVLPQEEKRADLWKEKLVIQANTQAAIHSARAIHDLFAQLLNGLLLSPSIPVQLCDIGKVERKLESSEIKDHIRQFLESKEYVYINGFVNTIKHRSLVPFGAHVSFETGESGVRFRKFAYGNSRFEALWAEDVLKLSLSVKSYVVTAGVMLNEQLGVHDV